MVVFFEVFKHVCLLLFCHARLFEEACFFALVLEMFVNLVSQVVAREEDGAVSWNDVGDGGAVCGYSLEHGCVPECVFCGSVWEDEGKFVCLRKRVGIGLDG